MRRRYHVYILSNTHRTVLYIGVTGYLTRRVRQHKDKARPGFTSRYNVDRLVYLEEYGNVRDAIAREKQLKAGSRRRKVYLIESFNPEWRDLAAHLE